MLDYKDTLIVPLQRMYMYMKVSMLCTFTRIILAYFVSIYILKTASNLNIT